MSGEGDTCQFCGTRAGKDSPENCASLEEAVRVMDAKPYGCPWFDEESRKRWIERDAKSAGGEQDDDVWEPISTRPDTDDLMWFCRGNVVDGPRGSRHDDVDYWDFWAPCEPPSTPRVPSPRSSS